MSSSFQLTLFENSCMLPLLIRALQVAPVVKNLPDCGPFGCFITSLLSRACQLLLRNNRRSYTVLRKCWHHQRNRQCISCNEFRLTDGRINDVGNVRDMGSILGSGRSPRGGNGNQLQYSCLENSWTEEPGGLWSRRLQRVRHD